MLKRIKKAEKTEAPIAKPNPQPMDADSFFAFVSKRYPKIIARLAK